MLSNANATLDLRPTGSDSFVFSGSFSGTEFTNFQITAGAGQRDLVTGTQMFATALSGAGNLQVLNGTGGFAGADGSMNLAVGTINIGRNDTATTSEGNLATLLLDSTTGNHSTQNRLDDAEQINIRTSGQFQIIGNGAALTTEDVGPLNLAVSNTGTPHGIITLTDGGAGVALTSDELIRATGTSMLVRGDGLGTGAAGVGVTTLSFGTAPTLTTAGSGSGTGLNILPYLVGDISSAGLGADFVTYGVDGLRPLGAGEYAGAITSGANVDLSSSPAALGGNADLLALKLSGAGVTVDLGGNTLDIENGAIISAGSGAASLSNGTITFGSEVEGFLHMPSDLNLGATIADNGGPTSVVKSGAGTLTITAPQTYTGETYLNEGTTVILGANRLTTNRSNVNGTLDLSDSSTTHTAIGMLSGSARGRIDLGDNSLEINGGGGNTSYFGTLNGGAGAVLTKSGGNTFTWRSNNNLALTPFAGTLNVTGGVFEIQDSQGRFDAASAINLSNGGTLLLDNQVGANNQNQNNRISNTAVITMDRGVLSFTGSNNARSNETVGEIVFNSGYNIITLTADTNAGGGNASQIDQYGDALLTAAALTRAGRSTGLVRGSNLGFPINGDSTAGAAVTTGGQTGDPGGSKSNLRLTAAPVLSHSDTSGSGRGVIPWLTGGGTAGSGGNTLVSFGTPEGIRLLDITPSTTDFSFQEFAAAGTLTAAVNNQNVYIDFTANGADATLDGDVTVRGLVIDNTGGTGSDVNLAGNTLTVESGIILSTGNQDNQILVGGSITFGNNDATGYEGRIHGIRTIVIDSVIADNGGNPVSLTLDGNVQIRADNTYSGDTVINTGRVYAYTANGSTNRIPDTSVLTINGNGRLAINASDETVGGLEGTGFVENYNNAAANESTFTINNSGDHVFQGVVLDGRAAPLHFVKDGAGSQTLTGPSASTYTGTTGLMEGTLVLGGGVTDRVNPATVLTFGDLTDNTSGVLVLGDVQGPLDQTLAGIDVVGTGTANRIAGGNASVSTLTLNQPSTVTFAGSLGGAAGNEAQLGVVKNDVGELTVTGNAVYAGPTTVNGGKLIYQGAGSDIDGAITVNSGELRVAGAGLLGAASGSVITVADGGSLIFADGGTNQTFAGTGSILNLTQSSGVTQLGFGLDAGTNDRITLGAGQSLTLTGLIDTVIVVDGAPTLTSYLLIDSAADGAFGGTGAFQIGAIENAGNFIYNIAREGTGSDPD